MSNRNMQSAQSHAQYVPGFHFVALSFLVANLAVSMYRVIVNPTLLELSTLLPAVGLLLLFWYTRQFATANQDRIIRLEERLRLQRLLPTDLAARVNEINDRQLIAIRFASDEELPELARRIIEERPDNAAIKGMIRTWKPDTMRV